MTEQSSRRKPGKTPETGREARLKAALKANMAKRKAQARARAETGDGAGAQNKDKGQADG